MKRLILLALALTFIFPSQSLSLTFVSVSANPFADPTYIFSTSTSGFVEYTATVTGALPPTDSFTSLELFFGGSFSPPFSPIFTSATFGSILSDPTGTWGLTSFSGGILKIGGSGLTVGQSVKFKVSYTLSNPAGAGPLGWASVSPWSQNFSAFSSSGGVSPGSSGLAPEPGTLILLGSGLVGFGIAAQIRRRKKSIKQRG
ncbi:MAG: PEP-CTERM sorting domain-containing protein [bacterium]